MNDYTAPLQAKREQLLAAGVIMMDPAAVYVEDQVEVGAGTLLLPGTILRVEVTQGAAVKEGQLLVVLEAMKMENEILAPKDGTVAQVVVQKGSHVETGSPLIILA